MYITELLITSIDDPIIIINNILKILPSENKYLMTVVDSMIHPSYKYTILAKIEIKTMININNHIIKNLPDDFKHYEKPFYNYDNIEGLKGYLIRELLEKKNFYQINSRYTTTVDRKLFFY